MKKKRIIYYVISFSLELKQLKFKTMRAVNKFCAYHKREDINAIWKETSDNWKDTTERIYRRNEGEFGIEILKSKKFKIESRIGNE